jgi:hypothetical protein
VQSDIFSDLPSCFRGKLEAIVIDRDIVEILKNEEIRSGRTGIDSRKEEAHLLKICGDIAN